MRPILALCTVKSGDTFHGGIITLADAETGLRRQIWGKFSQATAGLAGKHRAGKDDKDEKEKKMARAELVQLHAPIEMIKFRIVIKDHTRQKLFVRLHTYTTRYFQVRKSKIYRVFVVFASLPELFRTSLF